jgi:hypothetical protein
MARQFHHLADALAAMARSAHAELWAELGGIVLGWRDAALPRVTADAAAAEWFHYPQFRDGAGRVAAILDELEQLFLDATQRGEILLTVTKDLSNSVVLAPGLLHAKFDLNGWRSFPFVWHSNRVAVDGQFLPVVAVTWHPPRGPARGTVGFAEADERLYPELEKLRKSLGSVSAAAEALAKQGKVTGRGSDESKAKRLAKRYRRRNSP